MDEVENVQKWGETDMKLVIIGLLSALLIWAIPTQASPAPNLNNSTARESKVSKPTIQPVQAQLISKHAEASPQPTKPVEPEKPLTSKQRLMKLAGIPEKDWNATDYIVSHESSWRSTAWGKPTKLGRAYGLCQALPASKMASEGEDYMTNPVTQLRWCHKYAHKRYGGWWESFAVWRQQRWW